MTAPDARTVRETTEFLRSLGDGACVDLIAIDGTDGVGKTTLANALQSELGGSVLSLDDFVAENRGGYSQHLAVSDLADAIARADRPVLVEGVCVLDCLGRVSVEHDVLIYVKRVSEYDYWYDEDQCDPQIDVETLLEKEANLSRAFTEIDAQLSGEAVTASAAGLTPLREEIIRYHASFRPSRRADLVFLRKDGDEDPS